MSPHSSEGDPIRRENRDPLSDRERRDFLKIGLVVTGIFAGGTVLSLISNVRRVFSPDAFRDEYPYKPHYSMVIRQDRCIGCERCMEACVRTSHVPGYGWRTRILQKEAPKAVDQKQEFIPILCNHCNNPPCVRTCPTRATYKDKTNGIVMMNERKCIGCKSCMIACPYDARYFNEEKRAIDSVISVSRHGFPGAMHSPLAPRSAPPMCGSLATCPTRQAGLCLRYPVRALPRPHQGIGAGEENAAKGYPRLHGLGVLRKRRKGGALRA